MRELGYAGSIDVHDVDVQVAALEGREDDLSPIGRQNPLGGVNAESRQSPAMRAVSVSRVDVERVEPPYVALGGVGARRTCFLERIARRVEDPTVAAQEIPAGRL